MPTIAEKEMTQREVTEVLTNAKTGDRFKIVHGKGEIIARLYEKVGGETPLTASDITEVRFITSNDAEVFIKREKRADSDFTIWRYSGPGIDNETVVSVIKL